jgi:hypothetical protein
MAVLALACEPSVRGRCTQNSDCRVGASCIEEGAALGICVAASGSCSPACARGELCSAGTCAVLKPVVSVTIDPSTFLSPQAPQVTVHVEASPQLTLGEIAVEVDTTEAVASGTVAQALSAQVSVRATLTYFTGGPDPAPGETAQSVSVPALIDNVAPAVTVSGDAVGAWVPRTGNALQIKATADDGQGSGAQSATLAFDRCPQQGACSYTGVAGAPANGVVSFSFQVPRSVQDAGSEALLPVTVTTVDRAGNAAVSKVSLQIDDAPPVLGAFTLVTAGVAGEDGKTWFVGGASAAPVEIAVPVSDAGSGVGSVVLTLVDTVASGTSLTPLPINPSPADGTVHFLVPASAVQGREGHLRFSLTATDAVQHSTTQAASDTNAIWVDDVPPVVSAATVDLTSATPAGVCSGDVTCGRTATQLLRDDTAKVSFDVHDCGSGIRGFQQLGVVAGGSTSLVQASGTKTGSACGSASTNQTHHYTVNVSFGTAAASLGSAAADGTSLVQLTVIAQDLSAHAAQNASGSARLSHWRWKRTLPAAITGAPALLPGTAGARQIAVGTSAIGNNLFVLGADGSVAWSATLASGIAGDVVTGANGVVYAVSPAASCGIACIGTLNIVTQAVTAVCSAPGASFGVQPALATISEQESAVVAATATSASGKNLWLFSSASCQAPSSSAFASDFTGVSASGTSAFVSHDTGFSSFDLRDLSLTASTTITTAAVAPPAVSLPDAIYASGSSLFRTQQSACSRGAKCWQTGSGFDPATSAAALPFTPVFDGTSIWSSDENGTVYTWPQAGGGTPGFSLTLNSATSAPVLLQDGTALLLQASDGSLKVVDPPSIAPGSLGAYGAVASVPISPVLDVRGSFGVAYVALDGGLLVAVETPAPPLAAGDGVWPRPGRDSCNSRSEGFACP